VIHDELRRFARRYMAAERSNYSLQATALVNEAYIRLVDLKRIQWQDRAHFFAMSPRLMPAFSWSTRARRYWPPSARMTFIERS
jgi:hypothetical protein